jgi:hypothetical protein
MHQSRLEAADALEKRLIEIAVNHQITEAAREAGAINTNLVARFVIGSGALTHYVESQGKVFALVDGPPLHRAIKALADSPDTRHLFDSA